VEHERLVEKERVKERERGWVLKWPGEKERVERYIYLTKKKCKEIYICIYIFVKCKAITKK
jgi:hypothetical protein